VNVDVVGVMQQATERLEQLYIEAAQQRAMSVNVFGVGGTIDNSLAGIRRDLNFLEGEYRDRVLDGAKFTEGLTGDLAWEGWRDLADSTGQQLARILGAIDKWDLSSTLARVALDTGKNLAAVGNGLADAVMFLAVAFVAAAFLKGRS
jgi:hypothetical protein